MAPKLTPEQVKQIKEARRLEKQRLQEEFKKAQQRAQLTREIAVQEQSRRDINQIWQKIMYEIMSPVFKKDVEVMWHTFERALDKKNYLINFTLDLIKSADDQVQSAVASFCDTVDTMIRKFFSDLQELSNLNNKNTQEILHRGDFDISNITSGHDAAEMHLQLLLYQGRTKAETDVWATRGDYLVREDELRNNFLNLREDLRSRLEDFYNLVWEEYKNTLKSYVTQTAEIQKRLRKLRRKENLMSNIIAKQAKKMAQHDETLRRLKLEFASYEAGTKQAAFRLKRQRHKMAYLKLQKEMIRGAEDDEKRVIRLVQQSESTISWLTRAMKKGERILRIKALCRKYETHREKVLPFGSNGMTVTIAKTELRHQIDDGCLASSVLSPTGTGLALLWHQMSSADLVKMSLIREKELLQKENAELEQLMHQSSSKDIFPTSKKCVCNTKEEKQNKSYPIAIDGNSAYAIFKLNTDF